MSYQHSHRTRATKKRTPQDAADIDALLIDDEFDDFLDRHVAAMREAPADYRSF